jgi:predicted ABC-type exoprotein transport system permease subunit
MSLVGILLGLINVAIVVAILLLIGAVIVWFCSWMNMTIPAQVQKGFLVVVLLIGLYMIVALLAGIPTIHVITSAT